MRRVWPDGRTSAWAIVVLLACEIAFLPWSGHLFDSTVFFTLADSVFFAHTPLTANWSFGSISLLVVLLSQLPVLFDPALAAANTTRLFLLKLPSWLADIGTAAIVRASSADPAYANFWALRYLLDPVVIFTTVLHGQWDALPNLFAVAGIASIAMEKYDLAALALGLGTGTKFYPATFVPLLLVVAYKRASLPTALRAFGLFAATAAITLAPVFAGRLDYVVHSYTFNSFSSGQGVFTFSLWSLLPRQFAPSARVEQLVAVAIPVALAATELRHVPRGRDVARAAMLSAMSIVLLNPGAHPPFYLWIAGPLVLYAAIANDGLVSLAGLMLSGGSVLAQFCLEGSGEYFLLSFGATPGAHALACVASTHRLEWAILASAAVIVLASYSEPIGEAWARRWRVAAQLLAMFAAIVFFTQIATAAASAARAPRVAALSTTKADRFYLLAIVPVKQMDGDDCQLVYDSYGSASYAGIPFAARFVKVSLGYSLVSPERLAVRGLPLDLSSLPARYVYLDVVPLNESPVRITNEFDVTPLLQPLSARERVFEKPCNLIRENPLLMYRLDMDAARAAASREPLWKRLNVFSQETPGPASITGTP